MSKGAALRATLLADQIEGSDRPVVPPTQTLETIVVCGRHLIADSTGALYWPDEQTLIIADLHLEKATSRAAHGTLLPPYDSQATLIRLAEVIDKYDPARVVALGDSFHDAGAASRLSRENLEAIAIMQEERDWYWVAGNHDPEIPAALGGRAVPALIVGGLHLRHLPYGGPTTHEIAGHLHPAARLVTHGTAIRRPCFVANGRRLIMPAFGVFTGGLNVLDEAFAPLFGCDGLQVWMLGHEAAYPVAARRLRAE